MQPADLINGAFELFGGVALMRNVLQLYRDKVVRGVHWASTVYFTSWGFWNLIYYPSLDQWASFAGALLICLVNLVWLTQMFLYRARG